MRRDQRAFLFHQVPFHRAAQAVEGVVVGATTPISALNLIWPPSPLRCGRDEVKSCANRLVDLIGGGDYVALRAALERTAALDTAYEPSAYPGGLAGHCGVVALIIHDAIGGQILSARVNGTPHLWNRLPEELGGTEIDLTSCQFGGDGVHPVAQGRNWKIPMGRNKRFQIFETRLSQELTRECQ